MQSVRAHFAAGRYPEFGSDIIWSTDLMVLKVRKGRRRKPAQIAQLMGEVSDHAFSPPLNYYPVKAPKYPTPTAQLDTTNLILPGDDTYCENGY